MVHPELGGGAFSDLRVPQGPVGRRKLRQGFEVADVEGLGGKEADAVLVHDGAQRLFLPSLDVDGVEVDADELRRDER